MDKIKLSTEDIKFLLSWRDEHKDLVRLGVSPLKAVKIVCFESGYTITAIREGNKLIFGINQNGQSLGKLVFDVLFAGMCKLVKNTTKLNEEDRQAVLTVYLSAMTLLVFGNSTIRKEELSVAKNNSKMPKNTVKNKQSKGYTYILNRTGNAPRLTVQGTHSSPNGVFGVRGHFRHYKNGNVIWINEYTKGCGKKKEKYIKSNKERKKLI